MCPSLDDQPYGHSICKPTILKHKKPTLPKSSLYPVSPFPEFENLFKVTSCMF